MHALCVKAEPLAQSLFTEPESEMKICDLWHDACPKQKHSSSPAQRFWLWRRRSTGLTRQFLPDAAQGQYSMVVPSSHSRVPFDLYTTMLLLLLHQWKRWVLEQLHGWWRDGEQLRDYGRQTVCRMPARSSALSLSHYLYLSLSPWTHHLQTEGREIMPIHLCSTKTSVPNVFRC